MNSNSSFFKNPIFLTAAAAIALTGAGLAVSSAARHSASPLPYSPGPQVSVAAERMEALPDLKALDNEFQRLAAYAEPAVVLIKSEGKTEGNLMGGTENISGEGSGVIFRPDGWIITNDHVVDGFDKVTVVLHDGREFPGTVKSAPGSDIAVVKIDAKDLPTLQFADSSQVKVGELAMAVGAPFGLENSVTYGHISATGRLNRIPDPHSGIVRNYFDLLQTDASINMGNSGGPLINVDGQVIGINSAIATTSGVSGGVGFAISSNLARTLAETLIEKGKVVRAYAGVAPENIKEFEQKKLGITNGAILRDVPSDGPGAAAGLQKGDVVVKVGTLPINNEVDLRNSMFRYAPGTTVPFEAIRDGQHKTFQVKLADIPEDQRSMRAPNTGGDGGNNFDFHNFQGMPNGPDFNFDSPHKRSLDGKAHLGVQVQSLSDSLRSQYHIPADQQGAVVQSVEPDSIAEHLNLKPGDVIESVGDQKVRSSEDLVSAIQSLKAGDSRSIAYARFSEGNVTTRARIDVKF